MKKLVSLLVCLELMTGLGSSAQAQTPPDFEKTDQGIRLSVGGARVELAVATADGFRLTVSHAGEPRANGSFFLTPEVAKPGGAFEVVERDGFIGIKAVAGELLVHPGTGAWTLADGTGKTLVAPTASLGELKTDAKSGESKVVLTACWPEGTPMKNYASGTGKPQLMQFSGRARVGAGGAEIPYYWTTAGYSALGVGADEENPPAWYKQANAMVVWEFPGKTADLYLLPAEDLAAAARRFGTISGRPDVPPRWTFGYMQSRWGWEDRAYIEDILREFRTRKLPVDAFIFDFEWYVPPGQKLDEYVLKTQGDPGFDDFGWNRDLFPEPKEQIKQYAGEGIQVVCIRKPRLANSENVKMLWANNWQMFPRIGTFRNDKEEFLKTFGMNFAIPEVREWYADRLKPLLDCGIAAWWNDVGENRYTTYYYWNVAENMAHERHRPGERFWSLNRSYTPGMQRFGVSTWTGDILHSWDEVRITPTRLLNLALAGMPYGGCDIGGFYPPKDAPKEPKLFARWMQSGVFYPVMRAHSVRKATPNFPWLYGAEAESAIRKALELRYRLVPYYYSLAHEAHSTGLPLMRPLVMEFPDDPQTENLSDQWLMGGSLMAAPILTSNDFRSVYLPAADWFEFQTNRRIPGDRTIEVEATYEQMPAYVRAGSILPLGPIVQHTGQLPGGPLELQIYPGRDATFTLVEDDGGTDGYKRGMVRRTTFNWDDAAKKLSWNMEGAYQGKDVFTTAHVVLFSPGETQRQEVALGRSGSVQF